MFFVFFIFRFFADVDRGTELPGHDVELKALDTINKSVTYNVTKGPLLDYYFNSFEFTVQDMGGNDVLLWTVKYDQKRNKNSEDHSKMIQSLVETVTKEIDAHIHIS